MNFYRRLLLFKKQEPAAIWGSYREYRPKDKNFYVYERSYEDRRLLVICAFTDKALRFDAPEGVELDGWELALSNYADCGLASNGFTTRPYELRVYRRS